VRELPLLHEAPHEVVEHVVHHGEREVLGVHVRIERARVPPLRDDDLAFRRRQDLGGRSEDDGGESHDDGDDESHC
jgi:hypothetical protein